MTSGPIFLDELSCTESDRTLEGCRRGIRGIGLTACNHTDDVWVQCSGTYCSLASEQRVDLFLFQILMSVLLIMVNVNTTV